MDNDHLVNTLVFMHNRTEEHHAMTGRSFGPVLLARIRLMTKEAKKRSLLPLVYRKIGDVREMVKATHELHSKPKLLERALAERPGKKTNRKIP